MVVVGAFGEGNTYAGRSVTWDAGVFTIEGLGETALDTLRQSEAAGQFAWSSPETRVWAEALANGAPSTTVEQAASAAASSPALAGAATPVVARQPGASFAFKPWMAVAAVAVLLAVGVAAALAMQPSPVDGPGKIVVLPLDTPSRTVGPNGPTNGAPAAVDDAYTTAQDTPLTVSAAEGVLANDTDPDGDTLSVTESFGPLHGAATVASDGSFTYTPTAGYSGTDYLTYSVSDGRGGIAAGAADISVTPATHTDPAVVVPPTPKPKPVYTKHAQVRAGFFTLVIPIMGPYGTMNIYNFQCWFYAQSGGKIVGSKSSIFRLTQSEINRHAVSKTSARTKLLNALVSRMKNAGWTVTGKGAEWFAIKLSK